MGAVAKTWTFCVVARWRSSESDRIMGSDTASLVVRMLTMLSVPVALHGQDPATPTSAPASAEPSEVRPIDGIRDNSFLIEEAYNQEPGVVQHIFTGSFGLDDRGGPRTRTWDLSFTQEWPL